MKDNNSFNQIQYSPPLVSLNPLGSLKEVKPERNSWRDEWISNRHREFGWDAPMTDLDFPALEYNKGVPVALIEYKHYKAKVTLNHPSMKAMTWMADKCEIPFFTVIYYPEFNNYYVIPMNTCASQVPHCEISRIWSEKNYVKMLYWLRKVTCPPEILIKMKTNLLPDYAEPMTIIE